MEQVEVVQKAVDGQHDGFHDEHEDQVADDLAEIDGGAVHGCEQQPVQTAAVFLDGQRAVQSQRAGKSKRGPQDTCRDGLAGADVELEGEVEDEDDEQREDEHGREQFA